MRGPDLELHCTRELSLHGPLFLHLEVLVADKASVIMLFTALVAWFQDTLKRTLCVRGPIKSSLKKRRGCRRGNFFYPRRGRGKISTTKSLPILIYRSGLNPEEGGES